KNMHSGFNGLQSGTALIVLSFLILKSALDNKLEDIYTIAAITGSLAVGAAIGAGFAVQHYLFAGIIMLMPHIVNFLMYVYWRVMNRRHPDDPRYAPAKFGKIRDDGTLEVPNPYTMKWLLPYYFRMTEKQVVYSMLLLTMAFCALGFFVPG
ncbi:MAG: UDP-N-acetylglucosamine-1-phosphate transferase, partial [Thermoplasmata archaeon]|nr:UDP-N-acetylglucosamine-1-phosphate transferase [Thermoplasmata archaeon]